MSGPNIAASNLDLSLYLGPCASLSAIVGSRRSPEAHAVWHLAFAS